MNSSNSSKKLLQGAFILSSAAILSKLIGTLQKIPLQNIAGDSVFGIYNTVYPFYIMLVTLATAGFPIAVSKLVAEAEARGDEEEGRRVLKATTILLAIIGGCLCVLTYWSAPLIGGLIDNSEVIASVRAASLSLLFVPVMAGLRGYFQGLQNMVPTAVSQVTEQTIRVTVMLIVLFLLMGYGAGAEDIAAGAMLGSAAGGAAGLVVMWIFWLKRSRSKGFPQMENRSGVKAKPLVREEKSTRALLRTVLKYAIPVALGSVAVPLINMVDTFTVPRLLKQEGLSDLEAMGTFGIYNRGLPLVQLVTMLATSLSVLFVPALAEARIRQDQAGIQRHSSLALKWFWLIGLAASVGIMVLAEPINRMLYMNAEGTMTLRILALSAAGSTVSVIAAALLQGLGSAKAPALIMLAAAAIKTLLNLVLVPPLGISGAAISPAAAFAAAAAMNALLLARLLQLRVSPSAALLKPALVTAAMAAFAAIVSAGAAVLCTSAAGLSADGRITALVQSLLGVAAGVLVFVLGAIRTKLITAAEIAVLPKGAKLIQLLQKLKLL
ncbi:polysaccharide biosynthesis protein [Paenibacillus sp. PDC88]|uniref:putative polysaccharide biosynthesis protein n=1 Tax=Paenibacillus sp. PDC88 TaxID=1884375 RepID=UPI0008984404|nr:polysaccharide biosynthesis protein [Paenibacillus sp. PDC88]SDX76395.1 Membrane protein involved in the export of O-antigen and teichoic acid [Paenibacillus sp. PDC88]